MDLNIAEKNEQLVTLSIFYGHTFFKFYIATPFQNAQKLALWFSKWKVMTI
jgi:hypothetical protein